MIPLIIQDQFYTIQNLQRSPIPQKSNWSGTFFCSFFQQTGSTYLHAAPCTYKIYLITNFLSKMKSFYYLQGYYKDTVEFYFDDRNQCKNFWKKCVEHHSFFRCSSSLAGEREKHRLLSRGSSFR